ncbi:FAD-binding oxidoreductase [Streptosporangium sp. NPDC051022]|uniref:NAD(P)/FAD-dependent oxidoreductase n=1 Tax=Streptosporangium sp. NPDC051022 TaxID=3155752 RepID=UPI00343E0712
MDVIVIGAGIQGLSVAHCLSETPGTRVTVLDAGLAGGGATLLGTGGVRSQFGHPVNVGLTLRALAIIREWKDRFGAGPDFQPSGYLYLATAPEHVGVREAVAETANAAGARVDRVGADEIGDLVPGLRTDGILGGWYSPDDGLLSPAAAFTSLLDACVARGVRIVEETPVSLLLSASRVTGVTGPRGTWHGEAVVVAAGTATRGIVADAGFDLPVRTQYGQVFHARPPEGFPRRTPLVLDMGTRGYFAGGRRGLVLGGADREETSGFDGADAGRIVGLLEHRIPGLSVSAISGGLAGARAASPDDLGVVGRIPGTEGLYVAGGFGHHGFMHALPAAEILADVVLGREPGDAARFMDPARFTGKIEDHAGTALPSH